jgi:S1-C subfamily serine protease
MFRPILLPLGLAPLILLPVVLPLTAQEQPRPQPETVTERIPMHGRVQIFSMRRGRLGVVVGPYSPETDSIGALIQSVTPNGPADKAGIRSGDIIVRINGRALAAADPRMGQGRPAPGLALSLIGAGINPGDSVVVQYQRGKERRNTTVIAGDDPVWALSPREAAPFDFVGPPDLRDQEGDPEIRMRVEAGPPRSGTFTMRTPMPRIYLMGSPLADLELAPVNPELGRYFGTADGVLVINVPPDQKLGLKPGDVVFSVDGRRVRLPGQLIRALGSYESGETFKLDIMRMKKRETVTGTLKEE